jgi:hypothetical protein
MKKLNPTEVCLLVNYLLSEDGTGESVQLDVARDRKVSQREKLMSNLLAEIYKIVHPYTGCNFHSNWIEHYYKLFQPIKEERIRSKNIEDLKRVVE